MVWDTKGSRYARAVLFKSNTNDNRRMSRFVNCCDILQISRRHSAHISHILATRFRTIIDLMHDDFICLKFSPKLRLHGNFFRTFATDLCVVFTRLFFVSRCLGGSFFLKFTSLHFESEVWSKIGYSNEE